MKSLAVLGAIIVLALIGDATDSDVPSYIIAAAAAAVLLFLVAGEIHWRIERRRIRRRQAKRRGDLR